MSKGPDTVRRAEAEDRAAAWETVARDLAAALDDARHALRHIEAHTEYVQGSGYLAATANSGLLRTEAALSAYRRLAGEP